MQIKHITVENFRCFKHLDIEMEKCHALIGENGAGKTAVLEAIDLATSKAPPANRIDEQDFNSADEGNLSITVVFSDPFLIQVPDGYVTQDLPCDRVILTAHRRDKQSPGSLFSGPFVAQQHAVPLTYGRGQAPMLPADVKGNIPTSVKKTEKGYELVRKTGKEMDVSVRQLSLQHDLVGYPNVFYFGRDREKEARVGFNSLLTKIVKDMNWRFRKGWDQEAVAQAWENFYQTVISTVTDPKGGKIMAPLKAKLRQFAGKEFDDLELSLLDVEQPFSKAFFSRRRATNQIEQKNLGSGISILIAYFLIELVSRSSREKFMFLIDEPELHLHPQLQQQLQDEFRGAAFQIVYTTQSDCLVDIAEWRSITKFAADFTTDPREDVLAAAMWGSTVREHLDEIKKWHHQKSIFFREDNQIFFSRRVLLVEGPAEKYGVPILARKLGLALGNITIASCNGKNKIPYYQLLCKAFGIPYFTLLDLDNKAVDAEGNARPLEGAEERATFATSLETLLGIGRNVEHKGSTALQRIDAIAPADIPTEVSENVGAIATWSLQ
jgi:predicted ATP-dependent endonuclease of OLD family